MAERKTLLLTGASRGIGHATVKYFNAAGWRVFTASRQSWASECPWADGEENHIHLDLEDIPGVEASLELIREKLGDGRLHALVDNAGISPKGEGGERLGVLETDYATWLRVFNVNLFSTALLGSKTTRATQGVAVLTLKKKFTLDYACPAEATGIANLARYRARSLPAVGALLKAEDSDEKQISLMD